MAFAKFEGGNVDKFFCHITALHLLIGLIHLETTYFSNNPY